MAVATIHISTNLEFAGAYEPLGDVLYLSAAEDDKQAPAEETPEGHAVRLGREGQITHITAVNARWLLDRDGEVVATLRDGRKLRLVREDVESLLTDIHGQCEEEPKRAPSGPGAMNAGVYGARAKRQAKARRHQRMARGNDTDRYVVPNPEGGWDVKKEAAHRASAHANTKKDAVDRARQIVGNLGGGEIRIANRDGRLIDSDTVRGPRHSESRARDHK